MTTSLIIFAAIFAGAFLLVRRRLRQLRSGPLQSPEQRRLHWTGNIIALGLLASLFYMLSLDRNAIPPSVWILVVTLFIAGVAFVIVQRRAAN